MFYWIIGGIVTLIIIGSLIPYILIFLGVFTKTGREITDEIEEGLTNAERQRKVNEMLEQDKIKKMYDEQQKK